MKKTSSFLLILLLLGACVKPQELDPSLRAPQTGGTHSKTHLSAFDCKSIVSGGNVVLEEIETAEQGLFSNCDKLISISIKKLRSIPDDWLQNNPILQEVKLSESVREIGYGVFQGSALTEIVLPKSVINIYSSVQKKAFDKLPNLKRIILQNPTPIALSGMAYKGRLEVPKGRYSEYAHASFWRECYPIVEEGEKVDSSQKIWKDRLALATFYRAAELPLLQKGEVTSSNELVRWNCDATPKGGQVVFPNILSGLRSGAFKDCKQVTSVTFAGAFYQIKSDNFNNMPQLESVVFDNDVSSIEQNCFQNNPMLKSVEFKGLREVHGDIFQGCEKLKTITFPPTLETIVGDVAFANLDKVFEIKLLGKFPPRVGKIAFNGVIVVPKGSLADYQEAENWKDFKNFREAQ